MIIRKFTRIILGAALGISVFAFAGNVPETGAEKSRIRSAGAGLCVPSGNSVGIDGTGAERYPADVRQL